MPVIWDEEVLLVNWLLIMTMLMMISCVWRLESAYCMNVCVKNMNEMKKWPYDEVIWISDEHVCYIWLY